MATKRDENRKMIGKGTEAGLAAGIELENMTQHKDTDARKRAAEDRAAQKVCDKKAAELSAWAGAKVEIRQTRGIWAIRADFDVCIKIITRYKECPGITLNQCNHNAPGWYVFTDKDAMEKIDAESATQKNK